MRYLLTLGARRHRAQVILDGARFTATVEGETVEGTIDVVKALVHLGGRSTPYQITPEGILLGERRLRVRWEPDLHGAEEAAHAVGGKHEVRPLMPGRVVAVLVTTGDAVRKGQPLVVLEAMKMQNEVPAPAAGKVAVVRKRAGDSVTPADVLLEIE